MEQLANLTGAAPRGQKRGHGGKENKRYLEAVRELPCIVCSRFDEPQMSPSTAHHPICERFESRKAPDEDAIPLCDGHHQGNFDHSKTAIHRGKETWVEKYGLDTDYIAAVQAELAGFRKKPRRMILH